MEATTQEPKKLQCTYTFAILCALPTFLIALVVIVLLSVLSLKLLFVLPIVLLYSTYKILLQRSNIFLITEEQIIYKYGVFSITTEFLEMYRIRDFIIKEPFLLRIIDTMIITVVNTDKDNANLSLAGLPKSNIILELRELVELQRQDKNVYVTE